MSIVLPETKIGVFIYVGLYLFLLVGALDLLFGWSIEDYPSTLIFVLSAYWLIIIFIAVPIAMFVYGVPELDRYRRRT